VAEGWITGVRDLRPPSGGNLKLIVHVHASAEIKNDWSFTSTPS